MSLLIESLESIVANVHNYNLVPETMSDVNKHVQSQIDNPHSREECYRASSIGRPWIGQVLDRWYPSEGVEMFNMDSLMKMHSGIMMQSWIEYLLQVACIDFISEKEMVLEVGDVRVVGHADIICRKGDSLVVLECKSMASHLFNPFAREPHDNYGYLSQLSFYTEMARRAHPMHDTRGAFLLHDRGAHKFKLVEITQSCMEGRFSRVSTALTEIQKIPRFDLKALFDTVVVPPAVGNKIPPSMSFSRWSKYLYRYLGRGEGYVGYEPEESIAMIEAVVNNKGSL